MTKRQRSAGSVFRLSSVLFIDLMASTFAVIILLTIVGAVHQQHEETKDDSAQDDKSHRAPVNARDLRITEGKATLGDAEEKYRHKCGIIDLYEDRIEINTNTQFFHENTMFSNELHDRVYKLKSLIKKCNDDKKKFPLNFIYFRIHDNNNYYPLFAIFENQNIEPWWDFMTPGAIINTATEEAHLHQSDINTSSAETSDLRKKFAQQLADESEGEDSNSSSEPGRDADAASSHEGSDDLYDHLWELLTEWIYQPVCGPAVQFSTHRKELLFTQEDVAELSAALKRKYDAFRIDGPLSLLFLLALSLLLFLRELGVTRGENKL